MSNMKETGRTLFQNQTCPPMTEGLIISTRSQALVPDYAYNGRDWSYYVFAHKNPIHSDHSIMMNPSYWAVSPTTNHWPSCMCIRQAVVTIVAADDLLQNTRSSASIMLTQFLMKPPLNQAQVTGHTLGGSNWLDYACAYRSPIHLASVMMNLSHRVVSPTTRGPVAFALDQHWPNPGWF